MLRYMALARIFLPYHHRLIGKRGGLRERPRGCHSGMTRGRQQGRTIHRRAQHC